MPVDLKVDSSDSDNNIFIFMIGIRATSRIKLFFTVWTVPALLLQQRKVHDMTMDYLAVKYTSQAFIFFLCLLYFS